MPRDQTIGELLAYATEPTFSFEFFPPRDEAGQQLLTRTISELQPLRPDWVSVTYGANGSSRQRTLDATMAIIASTDLRVMHDLHRAVDELKAVIDYGDAGVATFWRSAGRRCGAAPGRLAAPSWSNCPLARRRCRGGAPDGHHLDPSTPRSCGQQAGASFTVTQLFFELGHASSWSAEPAAPAPIVPGTMPVTSVRQLGRFAEMSGADIPARVAERLLAAPDDPEQVRITGSRIAAELCERLLAGRAPGLHFFTQNRSVATREILAMLRAGHR